VNTSSRCAVSPVDCNSRAFDEKPVVGDLKALAVVAVRGGGQLDDLNGPAVCCAVPITHTDMMSQVRRLVHHMTGVGTPVIQ